MELLPIVEREGVSLLIGNLNYQKFYVVNNKPVRRVV